MRGIRNGIGSIGPFTRHTYCAAPYDCQTEVIAVLPLL